MQWLVRPDGSVFLPVYFKGPAGSDYSVAVLQCAFDSETLRWVRHGDELIHAGGGVTARAAECAAAKQVNV